VTFALLVVALPIPFQAPDTLVVGADNPPVWGEMVELVEELRIGTLDGPEVYTFGFISGVAIGPNQSVYIGDGQAPAIRQYAADGAWIADVGRQGQGPGEYNDISGLRMLEGGPLALLDQRNGRVTYYLDGEYATSFLSLSGLFTADPYAVDTASGSYVKTVIQDPAKPPSADEPREGGWIHFDRTGQVQDTLRIPPEDRVGGGFVLAGLGGYYRPFTVMTVSTMSPHGYLVVCRNDRYALSRPLPDGRVLRIEREVGRIPIRAEEKAQWNAWIDYFKRRGQESGNTTSYGPIPDVKPYVRHLFVDDDGRIWVAVYAEARFRPYTDAERAERGERPSLEWNQPLVWEVIDPRGHLLGRVTLPDKTSLAAARGTTVWGVQAGEYGEGQAVRFRIHTGREES
jgi:hypothetical protein